MIQIWNQFFSSNMPFGNQKGVPTWARTLEKFQSTSAGIEDISQRGLSDLQSSGNSCGKARRINEDKYLGKENRFLLSKLGGGADSLVEISRNKLDFYFYNFTLLIFQDYFYICISYFTFYF